MKLNVNSCALFVSAAVLALAPAASADSVTFAQSFNGGQNFVLTDNGLAGSSLTGTLDVGFLYEGLVGLGGPYDATMTLDLTTTQGCGATCSGPTLQEAGFAGTFSIILNTPMGGLSNLLSGVITDTNGGATLSGSGGSGGLSVSGVDVTFTSDFVGFQPASFENFALGFSSVNPIFSADNLGNINSWKASGVGTYASNPVPFVSTPEPASMLLIGGGLIALGSFGRKRLRARQ